MEERRRVLAAALSRALTSVLTGGDVAKVADSLSAEFIAYAGGEAAAVVAPELELDVVESEAAAIATRGALRPVGLEVSRPRRSPASVAQIREVFEYWRERTGKAAAKLTGDRAQKVRARLAEGYTVAELKRAIDGCIASPFHSGGNETGTVYDELGLICRNGTKVETFIELAASSGDLDVAPMPQRSAESVAFEAETKRLREQSLDLLRQGKTQEYEQLLQAIRARRG